MSTIRFKGTALAVAQVDTLTVGGTVEAGDLFKSTINTKVLSVAATTTVAATTATDFYTAWEAVSAALYPEYAEITADDVSATVTLTANEEGVPFTVTVTTTESNGGAADLQTFVRTATTASSGPKHWDTAANWSGAAVPVTGVNEIQTITVDATGGTFTVTFGGQTTIASAFDIAAATLQANLEALSTIGSGNITVTGGPGAAGGGTPYTLTFIGTLGYQNVAEVTASGASLSGGAMTATPATGTGGSTGDIVYLDNFTGDIKYGLAQSAVVLAELHAPMSFTGTVGLPKTNEDGTPYPEYRDDYLAIGAQTLNIGAGPGQGSGRIKINTGTVQTACTVFDTGSPIEQDIPSFLWKGTHASNTLTAGGNSSVGVALYGGEVATILTLKVDDNASVRCGSGTTLGTITVTGGDLEINSGVTTSLTLEEGAGTVTINGPATIGQLTLRGGVCVVNGVVTLSGNTVLSKNASLDFSRGVGTVTITNPVELYGETCTLDDVDKRVASLVVDFNQGAAGGQVVWGNHARLTRAATA
jgi:hypothetical protein